MGMSRLASTCPVLSHSLHPPPPPPPTTGGPLCESMACLRRDILIFQVNWAVLSSGPFSWQQLPCSSTDYSHIHNLLFCCHAVMNKWCTWLQCNMFMCRGLTKATSRVKGLHSDDGVVISSHIGPHWHWFMCHWSVPWMTLISFSQQWLVSACAPPPRTLFCSCTYV